MSLLGIPDEKVTDNDNLSWDTNKIGGEPDWMYEGCELGTCDVCGRKLKLVVQIYCPLAGSPYHRTLYVSVCSIKTCWNNSRSWKVQRYQILDPSSKTSQSQETRNSSIGEDNFRDAAVSESVSMDTTDWCDDADDWGDAADDISFSVPVACSSTENNFTNGLKLEQLNRIDVDDELPLNGNHDNGYHGSSIVLPETDKLITKDSVKHVLDLLATGDKVKVDSSLGEKNESKLNSDNGSVISSEVATCVRPFDCMYLSVVDEGDVGGGDDGGHVEDLLKKYLHDSGTDMKSLHKRSDVGGDGGTEEYEKTNIKGDKYSHKFYKRLKSCPQQCIRYCWNGQPMYISQPNLPREITCPNCNGPCVFELQLMPPLINFLKNSDGERVEFGTVIIYTCKSSCASSTCVVESLFVQPDPDHHLFI